jgi:hypothetical protein
MLGENPSKTQMTLPYIIPAIYLAAFIICMLLAYPFGSENSDYFLGLFALTLPWSILAGFFILGGLHLGDDTGIIIIFSILAIINGGLLYLIT